MSLKNKIDMIKKNPTEEIITVDELEILLEKKKNPTAYMGITPTGPVHIGYLIPLTKFLHFQDIGIESKILIADIHAALDDRKTPWEELGIRSEFYLKCLELAFPWTKKPEFVLGSSFELDKNYVYDILRLSTFTTATRATRAASEVVRMTDPKVSSLIYPIMQALDEEYLDIDIQIGGMDQRHILVFAREILPLIGYKPRIELMTSLLASLKGPESKMSASLPETHIKVYDSEETIKQRISNAYCPLGEVKDNPIMQICKFLIFSLRKEFKIERKFGGELTLKSYEELEKLFLKKEVHPLDLKIALSRELIGMLSKVRNYFEKHRDILENLGKNFLT